MKLTVNGKPIIFRNSEGKELPVKSGSELAKKLLKKGWINEVNSYYIVTNHKGKDQDVYKQAIHLIMEDTDGVYVASLRLPEYVDEQIADNTFTAEQKSQLQDQKNKLISLRHQIVDAYL